MVAKAETDRVEFIRLVMEERERMTTVGKELLQLLSEHKAQTFSNLDRNVKLQIDEKVLGLAKHLGNIAGFCDSGGRRVIQTFNTRIFGLSMFKGYSYIYLRALLPTIVGIQVDYTKKPPFKLIGIDIKTLGSQIKGFVER
jgi:hypothetical protein